MAIAFVSSTGGVSSTVSAAMTIPTGAAEGNVLVAAVAVSKTTSAATVTFPAGWTIVDNANGNNTSLSLFASLYVAVKTFHAGDGTQTATASAVSSGGLSWACSCFSGMVDGDTIADAFVQHSIGTPRVTSSSAALASNTVTDATSGVWRASFFSAHQNAAAVNWGSYSPADTERQDNASALNPFSADVASQDSNGTVNASGGTSITATPSAAEGVAISWIGLLKPGVVKTAKGSIIDQALMRASTW